MTIQRGIWSTVVLLVGFLLVGAAYGASVERKQAKVREGVRTTLTNLYKAQPSAKAAIASAAGYAVFRDFSMKILVAGGGKGRGLAFNNRTKHETFMKMVELQAGLGVGIKQFQVVFVFETERALDGFVNQGWEFGGQATAAAKIDDVGKAFQGAISVSPGVWLYQLTEKGVAAEITATGTRYYKDDDLNP